MFPCNYNFQITNNTNSLYYSPLERPLVESPEYYCPIQEPCEDGNQCMENLFVSTTALGSSTAVVIYKEKNYESLIFKGNQLLEAVEKQIGKIRDQNNFMNVRPGDWIFFSHVNQMTHLAISRLQTAFSLGSELIRNITHVGVVTKVISSETIKIAESPGYGLALREHEYNIKELFNDEDVLFVSPSEIARTEKSGRLAQIIKKIGQDWVTASSDISNRYNLKGLLKIPFSENGFTDHDKKSLIEAFVDHIFKSSPKIDKNGILNDKLYFCSEFAQEVAQFSRFLQVNSITPEIMKDEIKKSGLDIHSENGRAQIVEYLETRWESVNLWNELLQDPLFSIPARMATPGALLDLALRHTSVVRVRNDEPKDRYDENALTKETYPAYVEYLATKLLDRYLEGELISLEDKEVVKILSILEKEMHYSKETLACFIQKCKKANLNCIEKCLEDTLTWVEKLTIYFLSREINRAVEQMLHHPMFIEFLHNPYDVKWRDPSFIYAVELTIDNILSNIFPLDANSPLKSTENLLAKHFVKRLDKTTLLKYIPLSLAYAPPSQEITNFLNEENIPTEKIAEHTFHLFSMLQIRASNARSEEMQLIFKSLLKSGIAQKDQPWMVPILNKISKSSGYSIETLGCIGDSLSQNKVISEKIEKCLMETLSVQEKMNIFFSNQMITLGTENLLKNSQFKEFVRTGKLECVLSRDVAGQEFLNILFPAEAPSFSENAQNYAGRMVCSKLLQKGLPQFMFKDVFLGLAYNPPSEPIKEFMDKEQLSQTDLVGLMYNFLQASI